jgi:hypothetical protein
MELPVVSIQLEEGHHRNSEIQTQGYSPKKFLPPFTSQFLAMVALRGMLPSSKSNQSVMQLERVRSGGWCAINTRDINVVNHYGDI